MLLSVYLIVTVSFICSKLEKNLEMSAHTLKYGQRARQYDTADFQDASVKRIIKKLSDIERAALSPPELKEV